MKIPVGSNDVGLGNMGVEAIKTETNFVSVNNNEIENSNFHINNSKPSVNGISIFVSRCSSSNAMNVETQLTNRYKK